MCFIDYNFFPILFFLGWNLFTAKQYLNNNVSYTEPSFSSSLLQNKALKSVQPTKLQDESLTDFKSLGLFQTRLKTAPPSYRPNAYSKKAIFKRSIPVMSKQQQIVPTKLGRNQQGDPKSSKVFELVGRQYAGWGKDRPLNSLVYRKSKANSSDSKIPWLSFRKKPNQSSSYLPFFRKREISLFHWYRDSNQFSAFNQTLKQKNRFMVGLLVGERTSLHFSANSHSLLFWKSPIDNAIQKRRSNLRPLLRTPTQTIYSLNKFQIPLCFSKTLKFDLNTENKSRLDEKSTFLRSEIVPQLWGQASEPISVNQEASPEVISYQEKSGPKSNGSYLKDQKDSVPSWFFWGEGQSPQDLWYMKTRFFQHIASNMKHQFWADSFPSCSSFPAPKKRPNSSLGGLNLMSLVGIDRVFSSTNLFSFRKELWRKTGEKSRWGIDPGVVSLDGDDRTRRHIRLKIYGGSWYSELKKIALGTQPKSSDLRTCFSPNKRMGLDSKFDIGIYSLAHKSASLGLQTRNNKDIYPYKYNDYYRHHFQNLDLGSHRFPTFSTPKFFDTVSNIYDPLFKPNDLKSLSLVLSDSLNVAEPSPKSVYSGSTKTNITPQNTHEKRLLKTNDLISLPAKYGERKQSWVKKPCIFFSSSRQLPYSLTFSGFPKSSSSLNQKIESTAINTAQTSSGLTNPSSQIDQSKSTGANLEGFLFPEVPFSKTITPEVHDESNSIVPIKKSFTLYPLSIFLKKPKIEKPSQLWFQSIKDDSKPGQKSPKPIGQAFSLFARSSLRFQLKSSSVVSSDSTSPETAEKKAKLPKDQLTNRQRSYNQYLGTIFPPLFQHLSFRLNDLSLPKTGSLTGEAVSANNETSLIENSMPFPYSKYCLLTNNSPDTIDSLANNTSLLASWGEKKGLKIFQKNTVNPSTEPLGFSGGIVNPPSRWGIDTLKEKKTEPLGGEIEVYGEKPMFKSRTIHGPPLKNQKESISLPNYFKNITNQNYQNLSPSQFNEIYYVFWILFSKTLFIYLSLYYLKKFITFLGTEYIRNLFKIFVTLKFIDGNILSIIKTFQDFNFQLNQQNVIDIKVNKQIKTIKRV